jgi:hypothetical protein
MFFGLAVEIIQLSSYIKENGNDCDYVGTRQKADTEDLLAIQRTQEIEKMIKCNVSIG